LSREVAVPRAKSNPSSGESERKWLGHGLASHRRPWALEEELFGPDSRIARQRVLDALEAALAEEESELTRMANHLHGQAVRIAGLKQRLEALRESQRSLPPSSESAAGDTGTGPRLRATAEPDYRLCRCEGFEVDSPTRRVGVVDGLRYQSRIDRPDLLEIRAGPFGRQILLIPVEEVDQILFEEGRLILRSTPHLRHDYFPDLLSRLRGRTHDGSPRAV
jgi:hypothetical protein